MVSPASPAPASLMLARLLELMFGPPAGGNKTVTFNTQSQLAGAGVSSVSKKNGGRPDTVQAGG